MKLLEKKTISAKIPMKNMVRAMLRMELNAEKRLLLVSYAHHGVWTGRGPGGDGEAGREAEKNNY